MPRAIVDPRELRRFAALLLETSGHLKNSKSAVTNSFGDLHSVWKDKKYAQFERVFADTMSRMELFLKAAEMYANYLNKKAALAERYFD
jgi:uncharacterized protein YukE